jgi:hypothetical protein
MSVEPNEAVQRVQQDLYATNAALRAVEQAVAGHVAVCNERHVQLARRLAEMASEASVRAQLKDAGNRVLWRVMGWQIAIVLMIIGWMVAAE